jgi:hypothetical protein
MRSAILLGAAALATFALVLTSAPDAGAATVLTTGPTQAATRNQVPTCYVANIDKKPITVTAQLIDATTGMLESGFDNLCPVPPATLAPGTACSVTFEPPLSSVTAVSVNLWKSDQRLTRVVDPVALSFGHRG